MNLSIKEFYHQAQKLAREYFPAAKLETQEIFSQFAEID